MAEKMLKARIQHKHDFEANWKKAKNFIPLNGELIIYNAEVIRLKTYSVSFMTPTNLIEGSYEITSIEGLTVSTKDGDITFLSGITEKNLENAIALQISEMSEDKCKIILSIDYILPEDREEPIEFARFKIGNGTDFVNNLPFYAFAEEDEEVENKLYQKTNTYVGDAKYITNMVKNTECIIETGPDSEYGYGFGAVSPLINSKNIAMVNTLITSSGYTENGITYTLLSDGGISIKGTAITTGSFDITNGLYIGWGAYSLSDVMFSDSSDSGLLEAVEIYPDGSETGFSETETLTKLGVLISPMGGYDRKIKFFYTEGTEYNSTVYPQAEIDTLVPTSFVPAKEFKISVIEEQVDEVNTLIKGKYKFIVPETDGYVVRTPGFMYIENVSYSVLGDYGTYILSETQSKIDNVIGNINSILAILVEGSAE